MPRTVVLTLLVALALAAPVGAGAPAEPFAPAAVVAAAIPSGVLVSWAPGEELADAYRVYGAVGDTLALLDETVGPHEWSTAVSAGYTSYAVSGIQDGEESAPIPATPNKTVLCVEIDGSHVFVYCKPPVPVIKLLGPLIG